MRLPRPASLATLYLVAAFWPGAAHPVAAQVQVAFYPRAGLLAPDDYFYEIYQKYVDEEPTEWTTTYLGRTGIFGLGADIGIGEGDIRVRAEILHAFDGWMAASHSILHPRTLTRPPFVETVWVNFPYDMTMTSVHLVLPTRLRVWKTEPYVSAGIGGKFYRFGSPDREWKANAVYPENGFSWAGDLGAGLNAALTESLTLDLHVRDSISKYWEKNQNDFVFSAAVAWRIR